jgi:hypothetical protein
MDRTISRFPSAREQTDENKKIDCDLKKRAIDNHLIRPPHNKRCSAASCFPIDRANHDERYESGVNSNMVGKLDVKT